MRRGGGEGAAFWFFIYKPLNYPNKEKRESIIFRLRPLKGKGGYHSGIYINPRGPCEIGNGCRKAGSDVGLPKLGF